MKVGDIVIASEWPTYADNPTWEVQVLVTSIGWRNADGVAREAEGVVIATLPVSASLGQMAHGYPGPPVGRRMILKDIDPSTTEFRPAKIDQWGPIGPIELADEESVAEGLKQAGYKRVINFRCHRCGGDNKVQAEGGFAFCRGCGIIMDEVLTYMRR